MKRRDLLKGAAATTAALTGEIILPKRYQRAAKALSMSGRISTNVTYKRVAFNGGGLVTGVVSNADGTVANRTDVYGGMVFDPFTAGPDNLMFQIQTDAHWYSNRGRNGWWRAADYGTTDIQIALSDSNYMYCIGYYNAANDSAFTFNGYVVFISRNRGQNWNPTSYRISLPQSNLAFDPNSEPVKRRGPRIAIDPNNPAITYVVKPGAPTVRSFNYGQLYTDVPDLPAPVGGTSVFPGVIQFDPNSAVVNGRTQRIVAVMDGSGIHESLDGGETWSPMPGGSAFDAVNLWFGASGTFVVRSSFSLAQFKYWDGSSFTSIAVPAGTVGMHWVVPHPTVVGRLVCKSSQYHNLYQSSDGGATWPFNWHPATFSSVTYPLANWQVEDTLGQGGLSSSEIAWDLSNTSPTVGSFYWNLGQCMWKVTWPFNGTTPPSMIGFATGMEELVSPTVVAAGNKVLFGGWDEGAWVRPTDAASLDVGPPGPGRQFPKYIPPSQAGNASFYQLLPQCWSIGRSKFSPDFAVFQMTGGQAGPAPYFATNLSYVDNLSAPGNPTFKQFLTAPWSSAQASVYGGAAMVNGTPGNEVVIVAPGRADSNPMMTTNLGATWTNPGDLPILPGNWQTNDFNSAAQGGWHADLNDPLTFYMWYRGAGVNNGIWRSINAAQNWAKYSLNVPYVGLTANMFLSVPGVPNMFLACYSFTSNLGNPQGNTTTQAGIRVSYDGMQNWAPFTPPQLLQVMWMSWGVGKTPSSLPVLYCIGWWNYVFGVYYTEDLGASWGQYVGQNGNVNPGGSLTIINKIAADEIIYGRIYLNNGSGGWIYADRV